MFSFDINVDGGVKESNFETILEAGANNLIVGSDVFRDGEISRNISRYKR